MPNAVWLILAACLCVLGMSWLAVAMKHHWQQLFKQPSLPNSLLLRCLGGVALALSGLCCLMADHASMAVLVWVMLLTAAAFTVAMILSQRPSLLRVFCPAFLAAD